METKFNRCPRNFDGVYDQQKEGIHVFSMRTRPFGKVNPSFSVWHRNWSGPLVHTVQLWRSWAIPKMLDIVFLVSWFVTNVDIINCGHKTSNGLWVKHYSKL